MCEFLVVSKGLFSSPNLDSKSLFTCHIPVTSSHIFSHNMRPNTHFFRNFPPQCTIHSRKFAELNAPAISAVIYISISIYYFVF
jgi:hypothetical protein